VNGRVSKTTDGSHVTVLFRGVAPARFSEGFRGFLATGASSSEGEGEEGWLMHSVVVVETDQSDVAEEGEPGISTGLHWWYPSHAFSLIREYPIT